MPKFMRFHTDVDNYRAMPEIRLWCAVLKRALDDILYFPPDTKDYHYALEWLTTPGDENQQGTLSNVVANITKSSDLHETVVRKLQELISSKEALSKYKVACIVSSIHQFTGLIAKKPMS